MHPKTDELNAAKVNLNQFLGLLHKCEDSTLAMLEAVDTIDIPQSWGNVDIIKQTVTLMVGVPYNVYNTS